MKINCDFSDLRLILNIAETSSLTVGAERSHLSPPAASARLKKVQESIGQALFHRTANGLMPTAAAHTFIGGARAILQQLERLEQEMESQAKRVSSCIRLLSTVLAVNGLVRDAIEAFMLTHPDISFNLQERSSRDISSALKAKQAEIGVLSLNDIPRDDLLVYHPLKIEDLVLIASPAHPLAAEDSVEFAQALKFDFISLYEKSPFYQFIKGAVSQEKALMKIRIHTQNFEALCDLVAAGLGIALIPHSEAIQKSKYFNYRIIRMMDKWAVREVYIATHRDKTADPGIKALVDWILQSQNMKNDVSGLAFPKT
ncbi:hypothetical protein CAL29_00340 [Bordetella genomosp. 10]|uniref:HTH lysR-type domain-containing protein n=1 Tax=Bordetella genomosp. 10 TaxID=1416804 RepID=A0A261SHM4_9BORD|nr:LysR family transcriptional regulator [Bordetella genomosp. 10]OZI36929.1 hypothetical protein CAL29_00340 [Bordetella genomosp. 10]